MLDLILRHVLKPQNLIPGVLIGADKFVQLQLNCRRVAVLGILDQEHHEERDNRRPCVDEKLPCVGVMERRTACRPRRYYDNGRDERIGTSALLRCPLRHA